MSQPSDTPRRAATPADATVGAFEAASGATPPRATADAPKQIQTLPPLEERHESLPLSPRTGEPRRILPLLVSNGLFYLAAALQFVVYGLHWYRAVYPESFGRSAQLIVWLDPEPGKWKSLVLLAALAALFALTVAACGIAAFQSWNGWRWSRIAGIVAVVLTVASAILFEYTHGYLGWVSVGAALVGAAMLWAPPLNDYFELWRRFHAGSPLVAIQHDRIFYGRLPRYR